MRAITTTVCIHVARSERVVPGRGHAEGRGQGQIAHTRGYALPVLSYIRRVALDSGDRVDWRPSARCSQSLSDSGWGRSEASPLPSTNSAVVDGVSPTLDRVFPVGLVRHSDLCTTSKGFAIMGGMFGPASRCRMEHRDSRGGLDQRSTRPF